MSTLFLYGGGVIIAIALLLTLPIVKHIANPLFDAFLTVMGFVFLHIGSYMLWMFKSIFNAHVILLSHLILPRKHFNPTEGLDED